MRTIPRAAGTAGICALVIAACGGHATGASSAQASATSNQPGPAAIGRVRGGDWTRFDYDAQRSGVGPASTGITAANVGSLARRTVHIGGVADSSAIELHAVRVKGRRRDVIVLSTTYGKTIAIDPGTGAKLWQFVPSDIRSYEGSSQITTATPVADPDRRYVYASSPDGMIHKLSVATGRQVRSGHWPARVTFNPRREKIAGALNLSGRYVIVVTGGYYGDAPPYQGHIALIDRRSGRVAHVFNTLCSNMRHLINPTSSCGASDSAIWARAGAVVEPGSGRLLVATGNGPFNGSTNWGDSVLELSPDARQLLHNYTPVNQQQLNEQDRDLGSTAPALLPVTNGMRLAVQGGKDDLLRLIDLDRLDGTSGPAGPRLGGQLQALHDPGPTLMYTAPAVWTHGGQTYVFVATDGGTAAYALQTGGGPHLSVAWQEGAAGTSPIVAGGLLYVYDEQSGQLNVRNPLNGARIASLPAGPGHWSSPIVIDGRIILPVGGSTGDNATNGVVYIFHLRRR